MAKTSDKITPSLNRMIKGLPELLILASKEFVKNTPKRSGNARKRTKVRGDSIVADYPYAKRLDDGYSRQAPQGMTKPTVNYLKKAADKLIRK